MLRIALVQMRCEKGATAENLAEIAHYLAEAKQRRVDLIGFPEMSLSGYADPTRYPQAILQMDGPEVQRLLHLTRDLPAVVMAGMIEANPGPDKCAPEKPFITQLVAQNGQLLGTYRKVTIQDEEVAWFSPGEAIPVFSQAALTFGISICADISNESVFAACARQGAQIIFELAAPGLYGEQDARNWQSGFAWWRGECREKLGYYAHKYHVWIAAATQAGRTVDEDFPGGGYLFSPEGECLYETPDWYPGVVYLDIDLENQRLCDSYLDRSPSLS